MSESRTKSIVEDSKVAHSMMPVHPITFKANDGDVAVAHGINKRELFAAMVMQGWISREMDNDDEIFDDERRRLIARCAVKMADALLEELGVR